MNLKKKISIGVLLIIIILIGVLIFFGSTYSINPRIGEHIQFSYTKYPGYQTQIADLLCKNYDGFEVDPHELAIGLTDLNDDGLDDIVVFSRASGISGYGGGYTGFYLVTSRGLKFLSDMCLTEGHLYKCSQKTNGYYDILSYVVGYNSDPLEDRKLLLSWDQKSGYDYKWIKPITDKERKRELQYE